MSLPLCFHEPNEPVQLPFVYTKEFKTCCRWYLFIILVTCTVPLPLSRVVDYSKCESRENNRPVGANQCQLRCAPGYEGSVEAVCPRAGGDLDLTIQCEGTLRDYW